MTMTKRICMETREINNFEMSFYPNTYTIAMDIVLV